jgi:hypothetical protein
MEITGHSTREMFDRYNTVDEDDTRKAVDQLQEFFKSVDQMLTKPEVIPANVDQSVDQTGFVNQKQNR